MITPHTLLLRGTSRTIRCILSLLFSLSGTSAVRTPCVPSQLLCLFSFFSNFQDVVRLPVNRRLSTHNKLLSPAYSDSLPPMSSLCSFTPLAHDGTQLAPVDTRPHSKAALPLTLSKKLHIFVFSRFKGPPFLPLPPSPHTKPQVIHRQLSSRLQSRVQALPVSPFAGQLLNHNPSSTHALQFSKKKSATS